MADDRNERDRDTEAPALSHVDENGNARMVDVGEKGSTNRRAVAETIVLVSDETLGLLKEKALPKGDALTAAKIAGILAAKKTSDIIPLCHPLFLSFVDVEFKVDEEDSAIIIRAEVRTTGQTGVEMEALVACTAAALTIYDMCKAVQKDILITDTRLIHKSGGKSGTYEAD